MAEQVFDQTDRVGTQDPPKPPAVAPARVVTAGNKKTDFWNDPEKSTRDIAQQVAQETIDRLRQDPNNAAAQETAVQQARYVMEAKYGDKFKKFAEEVEKIVRQTPGPQQGAIAYWETCFNFVRGQNYDKGVDEARASAQQGAEPVVPAPREPEKPQQISHAVDPDAKKSEAQVAEGLGLSPESYLKGKSNMNKDVFPFTTDNRRRR